MFYCWNSGSDLKIKQTLCERHRGGAGAVRYRTDLCQWRGPAWVSSTEWQTCRRQDESQWCCWAKPGVEPAGTPLQRWWWSQTGALRRREPFGWTSEDVRLNSGANYINRFLFFSPFPSLDKYNTSKERRVLPISRYSSTSPWAFIGCRFQSLSHCGSWALFSTFCPAPPPFFIFLRDHQFCSKLKM